MPDFEEPVVPGADGSKKIPDATVARLPLYLRCLTELPEGKTKIFSDELAELAGVNAPKVRKDFSFIGFAGVRGHGYDVGELRTLIRKELGLTRDWSVALIGMGNLGLALANYRGLARRGFRIVGLFDADPAKIGDEVGDLQIESIENLHAAVKERDITMAVIATPSEVAQKVLDSLVAAGVHSVLNFAPTTLNVPDGIMVRKVDLSLELQVLGYYSMRAEAADLPDPFTYQPEEDKK